MGTTLIAPAGLPRSGQTTAMQLMAAGLNQPVTLAYGSHVVGGNLILSQQAVETGPTTLFVAHGEGEWEGPSYVWVNGVALDVSDRTKFHFHPGIDGENEDESDPPARNQKICSFFPADMVPRINFHRTAYSALYLPQDPYSPDAGFDVRGIYLTMRVREFDASGSQTFYRYSQNPAWCALDLLLRRFLFPHQLVNAALTTAVKNRIDFAAWVDWADTCDGNITLPAGARGVGDPAMDVSRWDANCAFVTATDLMRALELLLLVGQGYMVERNGKFAGIPDKPRASQLTLTRDLIVSDSFTAGSLNLRKAANQFVFTYRNIETSVPGDMTQCFQSQNQTVEDTDHQDRVGRVLQYSVDLGNSFRDRAQRLAKFERARTLYYPRTAACTVMADAPGVRDLDRGDVVTGPRKRDYTDTLEYQIASLTPKPNGTVDLQLQEYSDDMYSDEVDV